MRVAITGASGNVGTALLRRLAAEPDVTVTGVVRRPPVPGAGAPYDGVRWHAADVGHPAAVGALTEWFADADVVVHLAWQIAPSHDRERQRRTNVDGTAHVLAAARRAGVRRLVHASSLGVYAPGPKDATVDETWPATGVAGSGYSQHKAAAERLLDAEGDGLAIARMRPGLTFQRDAGAEVARYFLGPFVPTSALRLGRVPVVPHHPALRANAVHADDVADAYARVIRSAATGAFNVAADPPLDGDVLAAEVRGRTVSVPPAVLRVGAGLTWLLRLQPTDPGWVRLAASAPLLDSSRARRELGWQPRHDARYALRELLAGMAAGEGTGSAAMRPR
ncbi:NAD-dependent epimerase/dehydratase family protein [Rhizomonospora bruguierae]|uniref:NAD-dependent epimerase/dehydratase family protein n=1 Tax=Rhizomonospora bruguierae TaxID=1581705 RepID=UPI001BCE3162|nr:NAD-dependent epimerase/dehydratase family protein [Micromonospora sp. NBRC 107566]